MQQSKPTLLVMAAGMGSRYGGLKQVDPVGPGGVSDGAEKFLLHG